MGQKSSKEQNLTNESVLKSINKSVVNNTTTCQNDLSTVQNISIICSPSEAAELMNARNKEICLKLGNSPEECNKLKACNISDITQETVVSYKASCSVSDEMVNKVQSDLQADLQQKASDSTDAFGQAIMNLTKIGSSSEEKTNIKNSVIMNIENSMTKEFITSMINKFSTTQNLAITGTDFNATGITQKARLDIIAELASTNKTLNDQMNKFKSSEGIETKTEVKGLTDIISSITGFFSTYIWATVASIVVSASVVIFICYLILSGGEQSFASQLINNPALTGMAQSYRA